MRLCDLRLLPDNSGPYVTVGPDRTLVLTVRPDDVVVCPHCPNLHVRVLPVATAHTVRELAQNLSRLATALEGQS